MNLVVSDSLRREAPLEGEAPRAARPRALRVLAAIDGSERTGRVMKYLLALAAERGPIEVVLLSVQPKPQEWRLRGYGWFAREAIEDRLINDLGGRLVASAARHLDAAGIAHRDRVELGEPAEAIARCAREEACDLVLVTEPAPGPVRRWLLQAAGLSIGSVASVALHSVQAPVMAVR